MKARIFRSKGVWYCQDNYYRGVGISPVEAWDLAQVKRRKTLGACGKIAKSINGSPRFLKPLS